MSIYTRWFQRGDFWRSHRALRVMTFLGGPGSGTCSRAPAGALGLVRYFGLFGASRHDYPDCGSKIPGTPQKNGLKIFKEKMKTPKTASSPVARPKLLSSESPRLAPHVLRVRSPRG